MLIVCRTTPLDRRLRITHSQHHSAWRVERHDKTGYQRRPMQQASAMDGMYWSIETASVVKKYVLAPIGKVSALPSRIQVPALND
ncbi:hypothetical protein VRRI112168_18640 [Vreelandella rituensis]|uniref:Uncharacterized protein n=1 Tax=Vreelandella rituensis TaxID=2282306 RepID=A0A368TN14_9GAMM|nr:hypothetical protein [Halomonas rituensis]RCV85938.1 hypothetical protein DU506_19610 [Halomonas rituensis]